jgi:hypothetical protein
MSPRNSKINLTTFQEVYQIINATEEAMLDQLRDQPQKRSKNNLSFDTHHAPKNKDNSKHNANIQKEKYPKKKWCTYHNTHTHNTEECRASNKTTEKETKEPRNTYAFREAPLKPKNIG